MNRVLTTTLSVLVPSHEETRVLRGVLGVAVDPEVQSRNLGRLAPLWIDRRPDTFVRMAYYREQLRSTEYLRICKVLFSALQAEAIPFLVLEEAAFGTVVYGDPALRHAHDIDILVAADDLARATAAAVGAGFLRRGSSLVHSSRLRVRLETQLFPLAYYRFDWGEVYARSRTVGVAGCQVRCPSPADCLVRICGAAACSSAYDARQWACDAWLLIKRHEIDWDVFLAVSAHSRLELPISVMVRYLSGELEAEVPAPVLERLDAAAARSTTCDRDMAVFAARRKSGKSLLTSTGSWAAKAMLLRWLLLPSPDYVRQAYEVQHRTLLPLYYLARPISYLSHRWRRGVL